MTHKEGTKLGNDEVQNQMVAQESIFVEEVKMLRQQMAEMYEAWMNGQAPPSLIQEYLNVNMPFPIQVSASDPVYPPGFGPYVNTSNTAGTSSHRELLDSKRVVEKLIKDKVIEIRNDEAPNVTNNLLAAHNKEHVVGMVDIYEDCEQTCRTKMESKDSKEESSMVLESIQKALIIVNGASSNFRDSRKLVLFKINTDRIRTNNVCVHAFDGAKWDTLGEVYLAVTIGPVEFEITFQVINMDTSYNLLLGRLWIHLARAVPSTLHQVVKFEHDKLEIIVHGEDDLPITRDPSIPCIEVKRGIKEMFYDVNMTQMGEGTSHMDVQFVSPNIQLNNWETTPLPTRKESW
ncbi:hypothetical protein H5410_006013 [Solanum commersonii]|uniref:Uncharacterized protein n=1 Tax=Solanum commersonii TaxID=4109 RepID=A0A9J6A936_SOLCO|nr:hypothetical protein H5410_006013 [Solanum commersonii]